MLANHWMALSAREREQHELAREKSGAAMDLMRAASAPWKAFVRKVRTLLFRAKPASRTRIQSDRSSRILPVEFGLLILLAGFAALMTAAALEVQSGATAYIIGETHWSRAQHAAVHSLLHYARHGDPATMGEVRSALAVPLGDRAARLALESEPIDVAAARAGFIQGGNSERDLDRLVRMYRYFKSAPYFSEAVQHWREGDRGVFELIALTDEIEARYRRGIPGREQIALYERQIERIDGHLRVTAKRFSAALIDGARFLSVGLSLFGFVIFVVIACIAIMILRATLRRIRASEGVFRSAFHSAAVGMLTMDRAGRILGANESISKVLGYPVPELCGMNLTDVLHADDRSSIAYSDEGSIDWARHSHTAEQRFMCRDASVRWVRWNATIASVDEADGNRVFAVVEDVSVERQLASEMAHRATHDALTGLINRREIESRVTGVLRDASPAERNVFFFVDLDQFKLINDTCGHLAGDQLLRQIAGVLALHLRDSDWLGRLGGDEFAVLLKHTLLDEALAVAQRISRVLADSAFVWEGRKFNVTCSIGVVEVNAGLHDVTGVLRAADRACYLAKEDGRNCIRVYEESGCAITRRRDEMAWVENIREAIADSRVVLYAQRIEQLVGGCKLRYEVLVRLVGDDGRVYSPEYFMPAAERYGEAIAIDRLVVGMLLQQLAANPGHLRELELCHINLSAHSIANPEFLEFVMHELDRSVVPATKLCFELTETAAISNLAHARSFIDEMRKRDCKIALDDFGSGLSSFAYLKNLPVDIVKIDGIFVRDLAASDIDRMLVRSMCGIAHFLNKIIIAEWVESAEALHHLQDLHVDQVQGFAIHKPCPLSELIAQRVGGFADGDGMTVSTV